MSGRGFTWSWRMRRHRQDRGLPTSTRSNGWPGDSTGPAAKQTFEAEEIERILTLALRKRNGVRFVIALALGLRQGEALGLKWSRLHKPRKGDVIARLELDSPPVSVPVKLDITGLMADC